jgi:hypothetical protein
VKKVIFALAVALGSGLAWAGCSQTLPAVVVRSLERSGRAAFLCIHFPGTPMPGRQLDSCFTPGITPGRYNYFVPHVIALVTQMARGELAIVDVTAETVIDVDKSVPGYNFLPTGAMPTDIVATPGGNASFVAVGDPTRPGIFAIPSSKLPLLVDAKAPTFGSWPACALPPGGVPTEMLIVPDTTSSPSEPGGRRAHCDGSPATPIPEGATDLSIETEMFGRLKLLAMIPELGAIDVIDVQDLLLREPGSFDPCVVERRVFLTVDPDLPPIFTPDAGGADAARPDAGDSADGPTSTDGGDASPSDAAAPDADAGSIADAGGGGPGTSIDGQPEDAMCIRRLTPSPPPSVRAHPYALALSDDGRLFVSDDSASVIHVVDVRDPCEAAEKAPLLPVSAADPTRAVVSAAIAVSPLTSEGKRYVYASDVKNNGSLMVFDVSSTSTERTPLYREDRLFNPLEPPDRVPVAAPIESMTFATHEVPLVKPNPETGSPRGIPCDPTNVDDPNRPPDDFLSSGAGPRRLRGTFAFLALSNGDLNVFDLDDFDEQCRRPRYSDDLALGCLRNRTPPPTPASGLPSASQEASCKVVERHRPRSMNYFTNAERGGRHAPAMQTYPILYETDGTALSSDPSRSEGVLLPKMLGPDTTAQDEGARRLLATVLSSGATPVDGLLDSTPLTEPQANWVAFDLREPRVHSAQTWTVTYEGALPWFAARRGRLQCADPNKSAVECEQGDNPSRLELFDSSVGFCDGGAQGEDMAPAGDILEITENLPDASDPYWATATLCSRSECEGAFGTLEAPRVLERGEPVGRDIVIQKSYQGRLSLKPSVARRSDGTPVPVACCFPYPLLYTIRAGHQWIVTGQVSGFQHRLIPDPSDPNDKACIESCDPVMRLRNGRLVARLPSEPVPKYDDEEGLFRNAQIRFVIWDMDANCMNPPCAGRVRDRFFSFQESGGFVPMRFGLSSSQAVMPQSIRYVQGIQKLAIPDPIANGLMLFSLNRLATSNLFY